MEDEEERDNIIFRKIPSQEEIHQMIEKGAAFYQR